MKSLIRAGAVVAAVAFCAPALACSDMWQQQTTAQTDTQPQQPVAKAQPAPAKQTVKKTAKAQPKAKTQSQKVAAAN